MTEEVRKDLEKLWGTVSQRTVGIVVVVLALGVSLFFAVLTRQTGTWLALLTSVVGLGVSVFVIYLFYRLVLAVERIAERED